MSSPQGSRIATLLCSVLIAGPLFVACASNRGAGGPARADAAPPWMGGPDASAITCVSPSPEVCGNALDDDCDPVTPDECPRSCAEILSASPGPLVDDVYRIRLGDRLFDTWCDFQTDGGGWTLVINAPADGYAAVPDVDDRLDMETHGRLPADAIYHLLGGSSETENNVRVLVGDTWVVSMHIELPYTAPEERGPDDWSPAVTGEPLSCRVPWDSNGDCSAFDRGPDLATVTPSEVWQFANGSNGGSVGYSEGGSRYGETAFFHINFDTGVDTACNRPRTDGAWTPARRGSLWIR